MPNNADQDVQFALQIFVKMRLLCVRGIARCRLASDSDSKIQTTSALPVLTMWIPIGENGSGDEKCIFQVYERCSARLSQARKGFGRHD